METFDYSQVPYGFGLCASADCPKASTCLRHIALEHAPVKYPFLPTLTPQKLQAMKGKCELLNSLMVSVSDTFRCRLISHFGRKNYYLARKGDWLIKPADQQYIIRLAKECGLQLDDYFDDYVDRYNWGD